MAALIDIKCTLEDVDGPLESDCKTLIRGSSGRIPWSREPLRARVPNQVDNFASQTTLRSLISNSYDWYRRR